MFDIRSYLITCNAAYEALLERGRQANRVPLLVLTFRGSLISAMSSTILFPRCLKPSWIIMFSSVILICWYLGSCVPYFGRVPAASSSTVWAPALTHSMGLAPLTQWAAVTTYQGLINTPAQFQTGNLEKDGIITRSKSFVYQQSVPKKVSFALKGSKRPSK